MGSKGAKRIFYAQAAEIDQTSDQAFHLWSWKSLTTGSCLLRSHEHHDQTPDDQTTFFAAEDFVRFCQHLLETTKPWLVCFALEPASDGSGGYAAIALECTPLAASHGPSVIARLAARMLSQTDVRFAAVAHILPGKQIKADDKDRVDVFFRHTADRLRSMLQAMGISLVDYLAISSLKHFLSVHAAPAQESLF